MTAKSVKHLDSGRVARNRAYTQCEWNERDPGTYDPTLPGKPALTKDRRAVTCEKCLAYVERTKACFGCKKPFALTSEGSFVKKHIAQLALLDRERFPGEKAAVLVCGQERHTGNEFSRHPKIGCERAARERASLCPGCGEGTYRWRETETDVSSGTNPGELCSFCHEKIDRANSIEAAGDLKTYVIPSGIFDCLAYQDRAVSEKAAELLAKAATGYGRTFEKDGRGASIFNPNGRHDHSGPAVELTESQRAAMSELGRALHDVVDRAYRRGIEEGRSLLLGLATREFTIDEFNEREVKLAKAHQLPAEQPGEEE